MQRIKNLQDLFKRYRRPADLVFATGFFLFSLFLLFSLPFQTQWVDRTALFAQPGFWPGIAVILMTLFGAAHLVGALVSTRIPGRLAEVRYWARALEFVVWFMLYVAIVPLAGYLPSTVVFCNVLAYRLGYRGYRAFLAATVFAIVVVVFFKSFLQVRIPAGALYQYLPPDLRTLFMIRF